MRKRSTRTLYASEGLNEPAVEARLNKLVENPLARFVQNDMRRQLPKEPIAVHRTIDDPEARRAVALVFLVQAARGFDGTRATDDSLSKLMAMPDEVLDAYAAAFWFDHRIATFAVPREVRLFLPELGWYPFPAIDQKHGPVWGSALPINPRLALFAVPKALEFFYTDINVALLANFSVGFGGSHCARVVLSSALVDTHGVGRLETELPIMRAQVEALGKLWERSRSLVADAHRRAGLEPPHSITGTIPSWKPSE